MFITFSDQVLREGEPDGGNVATLDPPAAVETPAADPAPAEAPPTPTPTETEGDAEAGAEGDTEQEAAYPAEIEAELDAEAERRAAAIIEGKEKDLEERARVRAREASDGETSRSTLYQTAIAETDTVIRDLLDDDRRMELDRSALEQNVIPKILAGATALIAQRSEQGVKAFVAKTLPDPTPEETKALEEAEYDFVRNGRQDEYMAKAADLKVARLETEIAGLKKQLGNRDGLKTAAEKLHAIREQAGADAPKTPKGAATGSNSDDARKSRLAAGRGTAEDSAWLQRNYPG